MLYYVSKFSLISKQLRSRFLKPFIIQIPGANMVSLEYERSLIRYTAAGSW